LKQEVYYKFTNKNMFLSGNGGLSSNYRSDVEFRVHEGEEFETHGWPYRLAYPLVIFTIIWALCKKITYRLLWGEDPDTNCFLYDWEGSQGEKVKKNSASWKALDLLYSYESNFDYRSLSNWWNNLWNTIETFWMTSRNGQAVRNRFIISKRLLRKEIKRAAENRDITKILSLASGSAEAIIQVVAEMNQQLSGTKVQAHLVDIKRGALEKAKEMACKHEVRDRVTVEQTTVGNILDAVASPAPIEPRHSAPRRGKLLSPDSLRWSAADLGEYQPIISEMFGFLDYLPDEKAKQYMKQIQVIMNDEGVFLTCNILPNLEMFFLSFVVDWYMLYRSKKELAELPLRSGFKTASVHIEPEGIHGSVVARKNTRSRPRPS